MGLLRLYSYNSHGLGPGKMEYIGSVMSCDFLFVQEHWLVEERLRIFSNEINGSSCHGVSGMESSKPLVGRPYGGCSVLWKSDIAGTITPIQTQSKRLCYLLYECNDNNFLIFNVYMPVYHPHRSCGEYEEILDEISGVLQQYDNTMVIIGGDLNTDLARKESRNTESIQNFVSHEHMKMCINHVTAEVDFSFESMSNGKRSILDHFIILDNMFFLINDYYVTDDVDDFLDHSPIYLNLDIPISYDQSRNTDHATPRLRWDYASQSDISHYQSTVTNLLHSVQ